MYKYTSMPSRETTISINTYAISTFKKKNPSQIQQADVIDRINRKSDMKYQIAGTNVIRYKVLCSMCMLIHIGIQKYT